MQMVLKIKPLYEIQSDKENHINKISELIFDDAIEFQQSNKFNILQK